MSKQQRRERLITIVAELPEATATGNTHLALTVRGKKFGYYLDDHHGDGITGVAFKAPAGEQAALTGSDPIRFYVPAYVGSRGWVGLGSGCASTSTTSTGPRSASSSPRPTDSKPPAASPHSSTARDDPPRGPGRRHTAKAHHRNFGGAPPLSFVGRSRAPRRMRCARRCGLSSAVVSHER